ncbi:MAG: patatin-like phospholipase family protein [Hyphomicrobiaceae bacterium]|nr:patatin-like phospholipase family protein [Hyphomicrobiaceae bacterium]
MVDAAQARSATLAKHETDYRHELAEIEAFSHLSVEQLSELEARFDLVTVDGGEVLVQEGEPSDTLFLVVSGRFLVTAAGKRNPIAEVGTGKSIGEIGFFSGFARTATVTAARDSLVLRLRRKDFDALCEHSPEIWPNMVSMLARRLLRIATRDSEFKRSPERTIAFCHAGEEPIQECVLAKLQELLQSAYRCRFLTSETMREEFPNLETADPHAITRWLNDEEVKYDYLVFVADPELNNWSRLAIRHADTVVRIACQRADEADRPRPLNPLEEFAETVHEADAQRLVLVHQQEGEIRGTRFWLKDRAVRMHHHIRAGSEADYRRLLRFLSGKALGLVACGGGAYCAAHIGMFQAFNEAGLEFDIMGGTSGGAAMVGAYAKGTEPDELERRTHDIFVTNGAMRRATWPRYSFLDHKVFDTCLEKHYGTTRIEDLSIPYFAISTNLSDNRMHCIREGKLWWGIRASSAVPGLLPPVYTPDGQVLVDGSLLDNVPLKQMCDLKSGPNVIINFDPPEIRVSGFAYDRLPSRAELIRSMLFPFFREPPPKAPGPGSILTRSLAVKRQDFRQFLTETDLLFVPPIPDGMSILDWRRHAELRQQAYEYGSREIALRRKSGHAILTSKR